MARYLCIVGASLVALTTAQTAAPPYSICSWREPRGGVVRDTWYIEGGLENTAKANGICGSTVNPYGSLFMLNFSVPFDIKTSNLTNLFVPKNETLDPSSVTYVNGFIVAGSNEWYSFGGQAYRQASQYSVNSGIVRNAIYQPRPDASGAILGIQPNYQPTRGNATNNKYITNGAGVSVPSESLGFYFSGLSASNTSQNISYSPQVSNVDRATTLVKSMLKVDISLFGDASWSTIPLPDNVTARAEASMVWIPAGTKGALVIIGGVTQAVDLGDSGYFMDTANVTAVNSTAPSFMTSVTVYDVATGRWYVQQTSGGPPPQTAQACAVAATSPDNTTHNVYLYGGFNGVDGNGAYDDVWILSIPSFTWIKASSGTPTHARFSHQCAKPYPDQMMTVGGVRNGGGTLQSPIVDVFNLTTLKWTGTYDPTVWSQYSVPSLVTDAIKASPTASMDSGLASLLQTRYTTAIPVWYPYGKSSDSSVTPTPPPSPTPAWKTAVAAAVASVGGVAILIALGWFFWRKRQQKKTASTDNTTNSRISTWINGQAPPSNSSQRTDEEMTQVSGASPGVIYEADGTYFKPVPRVAVADMGVAELHSNQSETNSTQHNSPLGSPRGGPQRSPPSSSVELPSEVTRFELPAEPIRGFVPLPNTLRSHHLYPASVDGHISSVHSPSAVSSPSTNPVSDDDLPSSASRTGSNEGLSLPDNDMLLGYSNSRRSNFSQNRYSKLTSHDPRSPLDKLSPLDEDMYSPMRSDISPALSPDRENAPRTPLMRAVGSSTTAENQNQHKRNNSSLDSGLATLPSPGPREEERQSMTLAALPNSPERPDSSRSNNAGQVGTASAIPVRRVSPQDIANWQRPKQSAYEENDDLYGDGKDKRT